MKQLTQKLDDLFSEFDSGDSINLSAYKREIMDLVASLTAENKKMAAESAEYQNWKSEATELRSIILEDCKAKIILTDENDIECRLASIATSPVDELQSLRQSVLKRFDSKFRLIENTEANQQPENNSLLKNLHAYQS